LYEYVGKMADKNIEEMVKIRHKIPIKDENNISENESQDDDDEDSKHHLKHYKYITESIPYLEHTLQEIEKNISNIEIGV